MRLVLVTEVPVSTTSMPHAMVDRTVDMACRCRQDNSAPPRLAPSGSAGPAEPCRLLYGFKRDFMYQATGDIASIRIWLRDPIS